MPQFFVLLILGADRPGIVEEVARCVADQGGNWLESRLARLGGQFAGIVRIELPESQRDPLNVALGKLSDLGLQITLHSSKAGSPAPAGLLAQLEVVGQDRPGIVRQISQTLARHSVNVEDFSSECTSAPMSGENLFRARAIIRLPTGLPTETLRSELERIANDLMVSFTFGEPAAPSPAGSVIPAA